MNIFCKNFTNLFRNFPVDFCRINSYDSFENFCRNDCKDFSRNSSGNSFKNNFVEDFTRNFPMILREICLWIFQELCRWFIYVFFQGFFYQALQEFLNWTREILNIFPGFDTKSPNKTVQNYYKHSTRNFCNDFSAVHPRILQETPPWIPPGISSKISSEFIPMILPGIDSRISLGFCFQQFSIFSYIHTLSQINLKFP